MKKILTEKKNYISFSQEQRVETCQGRNQKIKKSWPNIPTDNITKLYDMFYAGAKGICDEVVGPLKNPNRKKKSWMRT